MSMQDKFGHGAPHAVQRIGSVVLLGLIAIVVLVVLSSSWYTVDQGERGVILRNGALPLEMLSEQVAAYIGQ